MREFRMQAAYVTSQLLFSLISAECWRRRSKNCWLQVHNAISFIKTRSL